MCAEYGRKKAGKKTKTGMTKRQLREFCKKPVVSRRKKNPHLTGKWQFVGMFQKGDIGSVKRMMKIHGIKVKVTADHYKREPGIRELYVGRGQFDVAYRAICRLFEDRMVA